MALPTLTAPYVEVAAPTRRPLRGGLLDAIGPEAVHDLNRLGAAGVMYLSDTCNRVVGAWPAPCSANAAPTITVASCSTTSGSTPGMDATVALTDAIFAATISCTCSQQVSYGAPFTLWAPACINPLEDPTLMEDRARTILAAGAWRAVENVFSTILPTIADDITPAACECGIVSAVAALEGQMASCYDGQGIIHAPAWAAAYLAQQQQFDMAAGYPLQTRLGTRFALGGGYTGDGPSEQATDCTFWMYITPQVDVYRGGLTVPYTQDTAHNTTLAVAEQPYAMTIDCGGVYGVRVNIDPCACPCGP
jgi:hypothetical protein